MYESLLARGNHECLVTIHQGQITKITPIAREANVCAGVLRPPSGYVDNGAMVDRLFAAPYGEYLVTVCYGKIVTVAPVLKEAALKAQDLELDKALDTESAAV